MTAALQLLTVEETAAALRVKPSWLYGKHHAKDLPFPAVKVGHYLRFRQSDVEQFVEQQLKPAGNGGGN